MTASFLRARKTLQTFEIKEQSYKTSDAAGGSRMTIYMPNPVDNFLQNSEMESGKTNLPGFTRRHSGVMPEFSTGLSTCRIR